MRQSPPRRTALRWLFGATLALGVVYGSYFVLLALVDSLAGGRQLWGEWLYESRREVANAVLGVVAESAPVVLPVTLGAVLVTVAGPGGVGAGRVVVRAVVVAVAVGLAAAWLGVAPWTAAVFAGAIGAAAWSAGWVIRGERRAHH